MSMITLYRMSNPQDFEYPEYYQLRLERRTGPGIHLVETHAWFDTLEREVKNHMVTLSTDEGFTTWEEAEEALQKHLKHRASEGFSHGLYPPSPDHPNGRYEFIRAD